MEGGGRGKRRRESITFRCGNVLHNIYVCIKTT